MSNGRELALIDQARKALAEAQSIEEVSDVRDKAAALAEYLRKKEGAEEAAGRANEIKLRAERRIGEMTKEIPAQRGRIRKGSVRIPPPKQDVLKAAGIHKVDASTFERIASIPEAEFEAHVKAPGATTSRLLEVAKNRRRPRTMKNEKARRALDPRIACLRDFADRASGFGSMKDQFSARVVDLSRKARSLAAMIEAETRVTKGV